MSPMRDDDVIDCMAQMKGDGQPFAVATIVSTGGATAAKPGAKAVFRADGGQVGWIGGGCTVGAVRKIALTALEDGRTRLVRIRPDPTGERVESVEEVRSHCPSGGTVEVFVEPVLPRPALIVCGASPTARALADLAPRIGFSVTVAALAGDQALFDAADHRITGFEIGAAPRIAGAYVIVATQGKRDTEALRHALASDAAWIGFVGSRKKVATVKEWLAEDGTPADRLARLHAPAGLPIGAATPEEIALAVLAEIVQDRRIGAADPARPTAADADAQARLS